MDNLIVTDSDAADELKKKLSEAHKARFVKILAETEDRGSIYVSGMSKEQYIAHLLAK